MESISNGHMLPVHLGLHKAGSTFLQHNVFPLIFPSAPFNSHDGVRDRDVLARFYSGDVDDLVFVSDEKLTGLLQPTHPGKSIEQCERNIRLMSQLGRPVKAVLFVREHKGYLRSAYLQRLKKGFKGSFTDYLALHSPEDLSWARRIQLLDSCRIPVLVITHAALRQMPFEVVRMMCEFWEVEAPGKDHLTHLLRQPRGLMNVSPVNRTGIILLRAELSIRKALQQGLARVGISRFNTRWKNRNFRDRMILMCNKLGCGEVEEINLPPDWEARLTLDWQAIEPRLARVVTEDELA